MVLLKNAKVSYEAKGNGSYHRIRWCPSSQNPAGANRKINVSINIILIFLNKKKSINNIGCRFRKNMKMLIL